MKDKKNLDAPLLIAGGVHSDERGKITFVNDCDLSNVKRFYSVAHSDIETVRAWQAHQKESKIFYCQSGSFVVHLVKIDDWINPSLELKSSKFILAADKIQTLLIPPGYANGFKALEVESELLIFSDKNLEDSSKDDFRFDKSLWVNWEQ